MKKLRSWLWTLAVVGLLQGSAVADVKLPALFADQMVVQRDIKIPVWGWADPGEKVKVTLAGKTAETEADQNGKWRVALAALPAGGPHELVVEGKNTLKRSDVLVGEVWICSGQSNMQWTVKQSANAAEEISAGNHPRLRMFTVQRAAKGEPQADCNGQWQAASPETLANFSAVAYFFGRKLQKELDVPVGLINTSWGGTLCEAWTSIEKLQGDPDYKPILDRAAQSKEGPNRAAVLYNGMIAPLVPYAIRGAIWYQGESNVGRAAQYAKLFPNMIGDWRERWGQGDFPFLFVQLAPYRYGNHDPELCAELWDAQVKTLREGKHIGMAVTTDITTLNDIHPPNKQDVGKRLALWALGTTYGKKDLVYSGPLYKSMQTDGNKIRLSFDHVGSGLAARDGEPLKEFTIAGEDGKFVPAEAKIDGNTVVVSSDQVEKPVAVRMGWHDTAQPNLINKEGLPASPLRTDNRPLKTAGNL